MKLPLALFFFLLSLATLNVVDAHLFQALSALKAKVKGGHRYETHPDLDNRQRWKDYYYRNPAFRLYRYKIFIQLRSE